MRDLSRGRKLTTRQLSESSVRPTTSKRNCEHVVKLNVADSSVEVGFLRKS